VKELWEQATEIYNLPLTLGLIFFSFYWVISSIGIFDFDTDADINLDLDADANLNAGGSFFGSVLNFVNAVDVPIMLVLTILNALMWALSLTMNDYWNPNGSLGISAGFFLVNFTVCVIATKYITKPLVPLFNALKKDPEAAIPLVGQLGKVKSRVLDHKYGQIIVERDKNAPALLNCKLSETDEALVRGDEVVVVRYDEPSKRYVVRSIAVQEKMIENSISNKTENESEQESPNQEEQLTTN